MFDFRKLRICFLAGQLGHGGAERQLYYVLRILKDKGAHPCVLSKTNGQFWESKIRDLRIPVKHVGRHSSKLLRSCAIMREVQRFKPNVVQSQHFHMNLYAFAAARLFGLREICASRNDIISEIRATGRVLGSISVRLPRIIAANSKRAIHNAMLLGVPAERFLFLPNVVDIEHTKISPNRRSDGSVQIIGVGSLWPPKRFDRFLSIVSQVRNGTSNPIRVLIVGDGPMRTELERKAAQLGLLHDVVEFKGTLQDVGPMYRQSDILMLTSDHEGTPNVVLEAMAFGLPIVSTSVGGVPEIVQHGTTGLLATPEDEESMVRHLLLLINNRTLRNDMGMRARAYIQAHHSLDRLPNYLERLYERVFEHPTHSH